MSGLYARTLFIVLLMTAAVFQIHGAPERKRQKRAAEQFPMVVCYYPNWSQYRVGEGKFVVSDIDPNICTHILYAFARIGVNNDLEPYEDNDFEMYSDLQSLKDTNPSLKTLISVGGATMSIEPFRRVSSTPTNRRQFAKNVVAYIKRFGFDGVDIDWEFPDASDRANYREMMGELRKKLDSESVGEEDKLQLSCALSATEYTILNGYDIPGISQYIDFANIMAYDLHGSWDSVTGLHSALLGYESWDKFHQTWVTEQYLSLGLPAQKAVLGIPAYGRSFTLCQPHENGLRDCASGPGSSGHYTKTSGILAYYEICLRENGGWNKQYDNEQRAPYAYKGLQWVGYDDMQSIKEKAQFIRQRSLGGVMFWDISMDDFNDRCGHGRFPLIKAAQEFEPPITTTPTFRTTRTTPTIRTPTRTTRWPASTTTKWWPFTTPTTTTPQPPSYICMGVPDLTFIRDPLDCSVYYQCIGMEAHKFQCPEGLYFNTEYSVCDWPENVDC